MDCLEYLQSAVTDKMSLEDIINTFDKMCNMPIEDDTILFETGTFDFTGSEMFYFSLVRQFPNEEDEYYQIHVDVMYRPSEKNKVFSEATWDEDVEENIFDYIRNTEAFAVAKCDEIIEVSVYMDET